MEIKLNVKKVLCVILTALMVLPLFSPIRVKAVTNFTAGQDCIDLIKTCEGFTKYKYWDYSQWTIGYGTGCGADEYPNGITEAEAEVLLKKYVATFSDCVNSFANKYNIELTQNQFDALVSMSYSLGNLWSVYDEFDLKTILINGSENYSFLEIAQAFGEWRKAGGQVLQGLVKRRQLETEMFLNDRTDNASEVWRVSDESGINLRESYGTSSKKTGFMVMNTIFAITDKVTGSDGLLWGKTFYEGKEQWCALDYCTYMVGGPLGYENNNNNNNTPDNPSSDPTEPSGGNNSISEKWKITSDDGVKLRSGPGLNYSQIGHVPFDKEVTITSTVKADGYTWGKTAYDGKSGWCVLDYAKLISSSNNNNNNNNNTSSTSVIKSIYIYQKPDKMSYSEGEQLDTSGMIVKAVYSDGTEKIIVDYDVSGFEPKEGTYDVKVTYMKKTSSFRVIVEGKKLTGIEIASNPEKQVYKTGEGLQVKGLVVNGIYSNDSKEEIKKYYLDGIDGFSKTPGKKKITVSAGDFTADFEVEVVEKSLTGIEITNLPENTEYNLGQPLDTTGMIVHALFDNGTKNVINDYTLTGYDPQKTGEQTITINYSGYSETFDVTVKEPNDYELPGDLDGNGVRDIFDLILLNNYVENDKYDFDKTRLYLADVNLDGLINLKDVEALSKIIAEQ